MTKEVLVSISGLQIADADADKDAQPIEVINSGEYYYKNGKHYILFDEIMEGFEGVTKNRIKIDDDYLELRKNGVSNVHMVFEKNKKNITCYETPYGSLMLGINANRFDMDETEGTISLDVDYSLDINYQSFADCKIRINVTSKEEGSFSLS